MQIVIDIPDYVYQACKISYPLTGGDENTFTGMLIEAILDGTPLPKGHGRLIDADLLSGRLVDASLYYHGENADMFDTRFADGLKEADIKSCEAPTIIEADKENDDEDSN